MLPFSGFITWCAPGELLCVTDLQHSSTLNSVLSFSLQHFQIYIFDPA